MSAGNFFHQFLVRTFPLRPIRDAAQLDLAITVIDRLVERDDLAASEQDYLDVLVDLVERYEQEHVVLPRVSSVDVLRHLMEENELQQVDLVALFGSKSIVSEVLSGKRRLSLNHIRKLSAYFGLPADVFIDD